MTARPILLMFIAAAGLALAGCSLPPGSDSTAFDDCYNRPPLYQQEHGCYEGR